MKKYLTVFAFALLLFSNTTKAQEGLSFGTHLGFSSSDFYDFNYGLDVSYLSEVSDGFKLGGSLSYTIFNGDTVTNVFNTITSEVEVEDVSFLTISGTGRYSLTNSIFATADLGYAIGVDEGVDGGFFYQPKIGYQSNSVDFYAFYKGISDESSIDAFGIGFAYKL